MRGVRALFFSGIVGKLLGVGRELLLAYLYGTGTTAAAYRVAQSATLIPVNFLTADALSAGFLPNHSRLLNESAAKAAVLYKVVSRYVLGVGLLVAFGLVTCRHLVVDLLAPGFDQGAANLAASMLIVMALGVPFYLTTGMGSYVEMSHGTFRLASVRPSVQSIGLVLGTIAGYVTGRPTLLAWGFAGAYMFLAVWTFARLRSLGILRPPTEDVAFSAKDALGQFWRSVRPVLLVPFAFQGALAVERAVASLISHGTVAAVDYARLITDTASALIAAPLGLAVLTSFSILQHEESKARLAELMQHLLVVLVPVSVVLACLATPVTVILFQRGAFGASSTDITRDVLVGLAAGLWAQVAGYVLVKGLNAQGRNGSAALVVIAGSIVTISIDLGLYRSVGPLSLGLGVSAGGLVQLAIAAHLLGLTPVLLERLTYHAPGALLAIAASFAIRQSGMSGLIEDSASLFVVLIPVTVGLLAIRPLRSDLSFVVRSALRRGR